MTTPPHDIASNGDYDFFYAGLERGELLVQRCGGCGRLRNPPSPMCPHCWSLDWRADAMAGRGVIYSYGVHHHPPLPDLPVPHAYGIIDLAEGIRFTGALDGVPLERIAIGLPVMAQFIRRGDRPSIRFVEDAGGEVGP